MVRRGTLRLLFSRYFLLIESCEVSESRHFSKVQNFPRCWVLKSGKHCWNDEDADGVLTILGEAGG